MGLFSSKKKITVGSTMYNLAGAIEDRVQYLPTTINTKIIAGTASSVGEVIQSSLIKGPGMRMRSYARWARNSGYITAIGMQQGRLSFGNNVDSEDIAATIPHAPDEDVVVQTAEIGPADYGFWADQWMLDNHPTQISDDYEVDMDEQTNTIKILFGGAVTYTFNPVGFDPDSSYLYFSYMTVKRNNSGPLIPGTETPVDSEADLPDTSDYTLISSTSTPLSEDLVDEELTEITYSDSTPPESSTVTTPHTDSYTDVENVYEKVTFSGSNASGSALLSLRSLQTNFKRGYIKTVVTVEETSEDIGGGVIKTTKVTTTTQSIDFNWSYRQDTQEIVLSEWSTMKVVIYKEGTGNLTYDAMFLADANMGTFLPFVPLRKWNTFIGPDYEPDTYAWTTKAVKRSMDKKIGFVIDQLKDNDSIGDIDFAYLSYGVSLNTKEKASMKYIYKLFQMLNDMGAGGDAQHAEWLTRWNLANTLQLAWAAWKTAQGNPADPLYGTPEPPQAAYPAQPTKQLQVFSNSTNYNMIINWMGIVEETNLPGLGQVGAKVGDLWFTKDGEDLFPEILISRGKVDDRVLRVDAVSLYWQDSADSHRRIAISGLKHINTIYKGKSVQIGAHAALDDPEESGFIVPLHEGVLRAMSLKDSTQMSTACSYMILNYYQVVKQKWYQSSWFKIVLIVVVIVITIVSVGTGAASAGVLGTAASVGAAIGLAGTAAIIAGAAINAIAGMLIAQLIMRASVALFGPEVGAIVGAVASVATLSMGTSLATGGTAMGGLQSMGSAVNLLKVTMAAGDGLAKAQANKLEEVNRGMLELQENYKEEMMAFYNAWTENLGFNKSTIDISELTESARVDHVYEQLENFLTRTLLTGSEIAGATNGLIGAFSEVSINTQLP